MSNNNMNLFKDEILNKIREIESKFLNELSKKNLEININYENFSEKVNSILESNRLMIESITNQKIHFEKISKLELITKKLDDKLITQEIRITNLFNDIKQMKANYDKIITDNLIIPGYLGPGCPFRSLGNFIISSTDEFKRFKDEKEFIKKMNLELKDKLDSMFKNMSNFVEFNSSNCRAYTDSKEREYNIKLDSKFRQMNEKTIETNRHIYSKQINFEEKLKEIGNEIDKFPRERSVPRDKNARNGERLESAETLYDYLARVEFVGGVDLLLCQDTRDGYRTVEGVRMRSSVARNLPARLRPGRGLDGMRVHRALHPGEVAVELEMRRGVGGGAQASLDDLAVEIDDHHVVRRHPVVVDPARLDDHQLRLRIEPGRVSPGQYDKSRRDKPLVRPEDVLLKLLKHGSPP